MCVCVCVCVCVCACAPCPLEYPVSPTSPLLSEALPAPPTDIQGLLSEDMATQIEISWEYLGDRDFIVSFTVYRQMSGTTSWIFVSTISDASVTSQMDSGVLPFTEYRFRVDATDRNGQEKSAYSAYYTTPEAGMRCGRGGEGRRQGRG